MSVDHAHFQGIQLTYREIDALQREFQTILQDLAGNQSLLRFRHQYQRLYRALRRSHENERILFNKISQLSRDMNDQTAKIRTAMRMAHQDTQSINFLKQELDKVFKLLQVSKQREEKNKAKIEKIQGRIRFLTTRLEQKKALSSEQSNTLMQLNDEKEEYMKRKEKMNTDLTDLKNKLSKTLESEYSHENIQQDLVYLKENLEKEMKEIRDKLKKDYERKKKIEEQVQSLERQRGKYKDELNMHIANHDSLDKKIEEKQKDIFNIGKEIDLFNIQNQKVRKHISNLKDQNEALLHQKSTLNQDMRSLDTTILNLRKRLNQQLSIVAQTEKSNDKLRNYTVKLRGEVAALYKENDVRLESLKQVERQILIARKLNVEDEKQAKELNLEREHLIHELDKQRHHSNKLTDKIGTAEKEIQELEDKISKTDETLEDLKKKVITLEKDKEKYGKQAALANSKFMQTVQQIKLKGNLISQFQKKNLETYNKLKKHQQLYEIARSDRNTYSKMLSETEDVIAQIKRRYKIVNHQISQLKEEISAKDVALNKERHQQKKKDNTIEELSKEHEKLKKDFEHKHEKIRNQGSEASKLQAIIRDSESSRQKLKEEYQLIVAERDILGTQLIRRNDQSALLYQKIKIQQSKLAQGEAAYRDRLADIKLLQYKSNDLKRELKIHMREANKIPKMQSSIKTLQEELIEEKLRVRALSEELENPLNDHRLRSIDGDKDPNTHEMKAQIQTLQRRLIDKTELVIQKQVIIHQKEKQINELGEIMAKQPGPQSAKRISELQQSLKSKTDQMKALAAQLNYNHAQINEKKYDNERTMKQIHQTQRKYHEQKKRQQLSKEAGYILDQH